MSLIVNALRRAQEGTTRCLPPFSTRAIRSPMPGRGPDAAGWKRSIVIGVAAATIVGGAGVWLASDYFTRPDAETPPRLLVVEPVVPSPSTAPKPAPAAGTSIEEVRAALLAAQPLETNATPPQGPPVAKVRTPPTRSVTSGRGVARREPPQRVDVGARTTPAVARPPVAPAAKTEIPVPNPSQAAAGGAAAIVKVHPEPAKEAVEAFAAGLKDQQGGQTAKAIEAYRRGIQADARNPGLFNNLGVALRESGHLDEAIEAFQAALNIDPKYEKALNNLGVSRYQQGKYAEAIDLFNQALRINPTNVESSVNIGMIYFLAERWDEALNAFQQALRYDPRSAEAHYNLGLFWERHGDPDRALQDYRKFIELAGPQHAQLVARVSEHLRQLERARSTNP